MHNSIANVAFWEAALASTATVPPPAVAGVWRGPGQAESGYASFISWPPSRLVLSHVVCASSCYPVIVQVSRVEEGWQQEELVVVGR